MTDEVLTAQDVAAILKCCPRVISEKAEKTWDGFPKAKRVGRLKRWLRSEIMAWLAPIRKAFGELRQGEIDAYRGYAITRLHHADNDFARVDHAINGFTALIERLMPDLDLSPMRKVSKKLESGILLELAEVDASAALLNTVEDRLLTFTRAQMVDAANLEMISIEMERLGLKDAA